MFCSNVSTECIHYDPEMTWQLQIKSRKCPYGNYCPCSFSFNDDDCLYMKEIQESINDEYQLYHYNLLEVNRTEINNKKEFLRILCSKHSVFDIAKDFKFFEEIKQDYLLPNNITHNCYELSCPYPNEYLFLNIFLLKNDEIKQIFEKYNKCYESFLNDFFKYDNNIVYNYLEWTQNNIDFFYDETDDSGLYYYKLEDGVEVQLRPGEYKLDIIHNI